MKKTNLFQHIPGDLADELTEILAEGRGTIRVERIVPRGHDLTLEESAPRPLRTPILTQPSH